MEWEVFWCWVQMKLIPLHYILQCKPLRTFESENRYTYQSNEYVTKTEGTSKTLRISISDFKTRMNSFNDRRGLRYFDSLKVDNIKLLNFFFSLNYSECYVLKKDEFTLEKSLMSKSSSSFSGLWKPLTSREEGEKGEEVVTFWRKPRLAVRVIDSASPFQPSFSSPFPFFFFTHSLSLILPFFFSFSALGRFFPAIASANCILSQRKNCLE